jgi:hypothetical protein
VGCSGASTSAADTQCADAANYGAGYFCQSGACTAGTCRTANDCTGGNAGRLCNASLACVDCASTAECTGALGANHLCVGNRCVSGNCTGTNDCTSGGQLCSAMSCVACTNDASCTNDPAYGPQHLCLNGVCTAGNCRTTSDCTVNGQVCNTTTHMCVGCSSDSTCKTDTAFGDAYICLNSRCTQGDCHDVSTECQVGQICGASTAHTCGACSTDTQCTMDSRYGNGNICYQGACSTGNCHATSGDCTGVNVGLLCGVATTNSCGPCANDGQCKSDSFYGSSTICNTTTNDPNKGKCVTAACSNSGACAANGSDFCCGSLCVAGNCCTDSDCGAIGSACLNHTCTACNAVSGNQFYVDPVNGNDATATGSGMSGATTVPGCAFKTIARAMMAMGATPPAGTKIILVGSSGTTTGLAAGDTLPIIPPANVTITTTGGPIKITLLTTGAGNPAGFRLRNNNSGVAGTASAPLTLDGNNNAAGIGILVDPTVATNVAAISNVTISKTGGNAIRVSAGVLNIGAGVVATGSSQDGLLVAGGVANISVPSGQTQTSFSGNTRYGIEVTTTGSVNISGVPGAPIPSGNGTVLVTGNSVSGVAIQQTPGTAGLATNSIDGLVSWANTNYGLRLFGGSVVKVRNSVLLANTGYGVLVSSGANSAAGNNLGGLDLGTASDFGKNYLQTPLGALGTNLTGGLCVSLTNCTGTCPAPLAANLTAAGNFMVSTGNAQVDCSSSTATITKGTCGSQRSDGINVATGITTTVTIANCN